MRYSIYANDGWKMGEWTSSIVPEFLDSYIKTVQELLDKHPNGLSYKLVRAWCEDCAECEVFIKDSVEAQLVVYTLYNKEVNRRNSVDIPKTKHGRMPFVMFNLKCQKYEVVVDVPSHGLPNKTSTVYMMEPRLEAEVRESYQFDDFESAYQFVKDWWAGD